MDPDVPISSSSTSTANTQQFQDIQNFLSTFNKEIEDTSIHKPNVYVQASPADSGLQQMYSTGESVQNLTSFIQPINQNSAAILPSDKMSQDLEVLPASIQMPQVIPGLTRLPAPILISGHNTNMNQFVPHLEGQAAEAQGENPEGKDTEQDQAAMLLNTGNAYQTVTIVPTSDVNQSGEVSYVLIVSQPDEEKNAADMSVFDFKEEKVTIIGSGEGDAEMEGEEEIDDEGLESKKLPGLKFALGNRRPVTQLMCNYCNYTSPKRYLLTRHMKTHSEERPHKCNICDRGFKTVASLQNHINTHTGLKPHKCKECDSSFTTSGELVRHVRYRHTFEKPHKCPDCDYASVELSKLKRHIRSHTGERPYQCPHCSYASPDTYKLKRHLRIHTGEKPYECDICHARFTQSNSMKSHRLIHTGEKPIFQCELCPTTCGRKNDLKNHVLKLHTSNEPIDCKKCGNKFPDRYTFKMHMKTHEGEKCFRCENCNYAASSQRHMETHLLTHTGEKPFQCYACNLSFRQKQLLRRHTNLYHNPDYTPPTPKDKLHECDECGKSFAHHGNMLRHMRMHDPDNPMYREANILKCEEEEKSRVRKQLTMDLEMDVEEHESFSNDITKEDMSASQNPRQVQVQLVDEHGEHAGQIYLQLENTDDAPSLMSTDKNAPTFTSVSQSDTEETEMSTLQQSASAADEKFQENLSHQV